MKRYQYIDLFCGCGGLSLGFEQAGFIPRAGIDFKESAINTYRKHFKNAKAICVDISSMDEERIKNELGDLSKIDVIIGGPPCQGFSNANKNFVEEDDPRNKLFFEFMKFVDLAQPSVVVIENVPQIITKNNGYAKKRITEIFEERKYNVINGQINRFRCSYSKFEYDNKVNRIIKYTCKQIMNSTTSKNQKEIRKILMRLDEVNDVPCSPHDCNNIRLSKMHRHYDIILSMSKMFLLNRLSNYTVDNNESFCFLFPTELLFEGFIGGFMQDVLSEYGAKVKLQQSEMHLIEDVIYGERSLGAAFTMRHDILVETKNKIFILDTKYKQVSRFEGNDEEVMRVVREEPKQTDIYQVCEYARKRGIQDAYLLYPMYRYEDRETIFPVGISPSPSGDIRIHFIRVPFVFEEDSEKMKEQLKSIILDIIGIDA